jgi:hypothetical protein
MIASAEGGVEIEKLLWPRRIGLLSEYRPLLA